MPLTTIYGDGIRVIGNDSPALIPQPLHPNVSSYVAAQSSAGYAMTLVEVDAVNNLVWAMVGNGIWDKMQVVYPCIGNSTIGANAFKWNLISTTANTLAFTGAWTFASTGMQISTRNSTSYAQTSYNLSTNQSQYNAHLSVYLRNFATGSPVSGFVAGAYWSNTVGGQGGTAIAPGNAVGTSYGWIQNTGGTSGALSISGYSGGFLLVNRTSNTSGFQYLNGGIRVGSNFPTANAGRDSITMRLGNGLNNLQTNTSDPQEIAFVSVGTGLTRTEISNLYAIVQSYQTALGRQV